VVDWALRLNIHTSLCSSNGTKEEQWKLNVAVVGEYISGSLNAIGIVQCASKGTCYEKGKTMGTICHMLQAITSYKKNPYEEERLRLKRIAIDFAIKNGGVYNVNQMLHRNGLSMQVSMEEINNVALQIDEKA